MHRRRLCFVLSILTMLFLVAAAACTPVATLVAPAASPTRNATPTPRPTRKPESTSTPLPTYTVVPELQVTPDAFKDITIQFWHPWVSPLREEIEQLTDEFNQTNLWGIQVVITSQGSSGGLFSETTRSLKDGSSPDLVAAPLDMLLAWHKQSGAVLNLNDYVTDLQWGLNQAEQQDFQPLFWDEDELYGYRFGIPALRSMQVLFYNRTWASELGFGVVPMTPEQFYQQACGAHAINLKANTWAVKGTGGWIVDNSPLTLLSWLLVFDPNLLSEKSTGGYQFNTSGAAEALDYLRNLYDDGCSWVSRDSSPYEYFANRQALLYAGSLEDLNPQSRTMVRLDKTDDWTLLPFPSSQGPVVITSGPSYGIFTSSKEKQMAAWLYMRWLLLPRHQARLVLSSGLLPAGKEALNLLENYAANNPQWGLAVDWIVDARPAPASADWRMTKSILEDTGRMVYMPTPQPAPTLLQILDDTIAEVATRAP
jgi:multiple sugar transport system substrate-binding protein